MRSGKLATAGTLVKTTAIIHAGFIMIVATDHAHIKTARTNRRKGTKTIMTNIKSEPKEFILLTIPDGYHIIRTRRFKNACPYDGTPLHVTGSVQGCFDGEFAHGDLFTCEKNCVIQYTDMFKKDAE